MPLSRRDTRALAGGGAAIVLLLAWQLRPASDPPAPAPPPPVAPPAPPVAAAAPPPAPSADVSQLRLFGVMASGAAIGMADGSQRFVPVGREVVPGVTLRRVALHHAVLATATGEVLLGFEGADRASSAAPGAAAPAAAAEQEERLRYRLGLAPVMAGGRVAGYAVRSGARLPALERAGIMPGDVIRRVNGARLDEERRDELAWTLANSSHVEIEVERSGRPLRLTLQSRSE